MAVRIPDEKDMILKKPSVDVIDRINKSIEKGNKTAKKIFPHKNIKRIVF